MSAIQSLREKVSLGANKISQRPLWQRRALLSALIGFFLVGAFFIAGRFKNAKRVELGVSVGVAKAFLGNISVYLDELGTVTAYYTVNIQPRVSGQIMKVDVKEGQYVHAGQELALIDPRPYQAALDQAQGALSRDQALLADAKLDLERYKKLLAQDAIPSQQYDTQNATVGQDEGTVESDQAAVETAKLNLIYAHVTSPIDGRVGLRLVDPGNMVYTTTANGAGGIFVVTKMQPITVVFTLPEEDIPRLMKRMNHLKAGKKLIVEAYSRDGSQLLETGTLLALDSSIQVNTGTLNLKAEFGNKEGLLYPNEFVNARLYLETEHHQTIIPAAAVQSGPEGSFVYVVGPKNTVEIRNVKVGIANGNNVSIVEGLQAGETVVTDGIDFIRPGSRVRVASPGSQSQKFHKKGSQNE